VLRWLLVMAVVGCGHVEERAADGSVDAPADALVDAPVVVPWELVQTTSVDNATTTATVPVMRLGAGHLVVVAVEIDDRGLVTGVTDSSGCNSYVAIPAALSTSIALDANLQLFYAKNSCPDATAIGVVATGTVCAVVVWEVAGIRTDDPLDAAAALNDQPASALPVGPMITTSAAGEFVVSAVVVDNTITGIHAGNEFTNDRNNQGNGWGHLTDPRAPAGLHQAQWDQSPGGAYCASAASFQVAP
jgi:hypothetical protein